MNVEKKRAMRSAIQGGEIEKVREMVNSDNELLHTMTAFGSWLHVAATEGNVEIMDLLIEAGIDVNTQGGTFKGGSLNLAASAGHIDAVKCLLSHGADLDVSDSTKNPLFAAVYGGHVDVAKLLLDSGIDPKVSYSGPHVTNMDAKAFAEERGQQNMVAFLEKYESGG